MDEVCIRRKKDTIKKDTIKNFKIHLLLSFQCTESSQAGTLAATGLFPYPAATIQWHPLPLSWICLSHGIVSLRLPCSTSSPHSLEHQAQDGMNSSWRFSLLILGGVEDLCTHHLQLHVSVKLI